MRKDLLKYDDVMNRQREVVYAERHRVLAGEDLHEQVRNMVDEVVADYVAKATADGFAEEWDLDQLWTAFRRLYPVDTSVNAARRGRGRPDRCHSRGHDRADAAGRADGL